MMNDAITSPPTDHDERQWWRSVFLAAITEVAAKNPRIRAARAKEIVRTAIWFANAGLMEFRRAWCADNDGMYLEAHQIANLIQALEGGLQGHLGEEISVPQARIARNRIRRALRFLKPTA